MGIEQINGLLQTEREPRKRIEYFLFQGLEDWGDKYLKRAYQALVRLANAGYVQSHGYVNVQKTYSLTGAGHRALTQAHRNRQGDYRRWISESLVRHEVMTNGVGLVLTEILGVEVLTETERYAAIYAAAGRNRVETWPDLWIDDKAQPRAIEVERIRKTASRYGKLWRAYRVGLPRTAVVLYIASFPNGAPTLLRLAKQFLADFIYVADLAEFKAKLGRCEFVGYRGGRIALGSSCAREPIMAGEIQA